MGKNIQITTLPGLAHPKYRPDIDGLRAIAVLSVVAFHAFPDALPGGYIGVDIFFVISGFLISSIIFAGLERGSFSFMTFYVRRIRRIFPALITILVVCFTGGWFMLFPGEFKLLGKNIAGGAGFVANFVLWRESGYFDNSAETKPLLHLWSLGIEEQFYILWPFLLWFSWRRNFNLLSVIGLITIASFTLNILRVQNHPAAVFYNPQTRLWELSIGSLLAWTKLYHNDRLEQARLKTGPWLKPILNKFGIAAFKNNTCHLTSLLGVLLIASSLALVTRKSAFPGWWALLPTVGALLIIGAGPQAWFNRTILSRRPMVGIGLISYPLYLWHWPLLSFAHLIKGEAISARMRLGAIVLSFMLAWITYVLIEKPLRFGGQSSAKIRLLLVLMFLIGSAGFAAYKFNGFAFRFPKIVQQLSLYHYNYISDYREGTCFLLPDQDYTVFATCPPAEDKSKKTLLLWGDSHAADLYPGYQAIYGDRYNIVQRNASGCAPIIEVDANLRPLCRKINEFVLNSIRTHPPDKIVLAGIWTVLDWRKLDRTIAALHQIGINDIDLVGPIPEWGTDRGGVEGLPKKLLAYMNADPLHRVPARMKLGLNTEFLELDPEMENFAHEQGVNYLSPAQVLCNSEGCLTRLGDSVDTLTAWDYGHLTKTGSIYLISQFAKQETASHTK